MDKQGRIQPAVNADVRFDMEDLRSALAQEYLGEGDAREFERAEIGEIKQGSNELYDFLQETAPPEDEEIKGQARPMPPAEEPAVDASVDAQTDELPPAIPQDDGGDTKAEYLSEEDLDNYRVKGKEYGEETEYTLRELRNIKQTQNAANKQLEDYKALVKEYKELATAARTHPSEAPTAELEAPEYESDEERMFRELRTEVDTLRQTQEQTAQERFVSQENDYIKSRISDAGYTSEEVGERISQALDERPEMASYVARLWENAPANQAEANDRKVMFDAVLALASAVDRPQVIQQAREEAVSEGRTAERLDRKRTLASVPPGGKMPETMSDNERAAQAAQRGTDGIAELLLESPIFRTY